MSYIELLKKENITFNTFSENEAEAIMRTQYSYYRLLELSSLFERYRATSKKGQFISLDFAQLYYLALIDSRLSRLLMCICLDIENSIKVHLIQSADNLGVTEKFLSEYYESDKNYLDRTYTSENIDFLQEKGIEFKLGSMQLHQFLNMVQFGTLEKMIHFFNEHYSDKEVLLPYEVQLHSVIRIRNIVAHNSSIISRLLIPENYMNLEMRAFLGARGIKNKTLKTNMSKAIVSDLVNVLYLFFNIVSNREYILDEIWRFDVDYCQRYEKYYERNFQLRSAYYFLKEVILIFENLTSE